MFVMFETVPVDPTNGVWRNLKGDVVMQLRNSFAFGANNPGFINVHSGNASLATIAELSADPRIKKVEIVPAPKS